MLFLGKNRFERDAEKMLLTNSQPKFYGRRQGRKLRKAKSALIDSFLPQLTISPSSTFDKKKLFGQPVEKICLEIGFGNGEHLAGQALKNPDHGFIGAEVFKNGIASLLSLLTGIKEGSDLPEKITLSPERKDNVRIFDNDIRLLFSHIPDGFIDKIFDLFPDPWPKKRHAFRRFINPENLKEIARILKPGGLLRIATDHKIYKGWALRQTCTFTNDNGEKVFRWTAKCSNDWRLPPQDWVETKYQRKAIAEGRKPVFLDFERL